MAEIICCEEPMINKGPSKKKKVPAPVKPKKTDAEKKARKKADKKPADKKKKSAK